jgi:hypothetical protein
MNHNPSAWSPRVVAAIDAASNNARRLERSRCVRILTEESWWDKDRQGLINLSELVERVTAKIEDDSNG